MADAKGIKVEIDPTTKPWYFPNYPTIHVFQPKHQETLAWLLNSNILEKGVDLHYNTPAVRLIRDGKKRVRAVIAQNANGDYIQLNVNRAIVLCTGDYGNNREMVDAYCWESLKNIACHYAPAVNTGDGHKMAMWIGAAIDEPPHCVMLFDWAVWSKDGLFNLARQPWLYVNLNGERFMNEDLPYNYACCQIMQQPGRIWWSVWDSKWEQEIRVMNSQCCKNMGPPLNWWQPEWLDNALKNEYVHTAPTIEELAQKMEIPVDVFRTATDRYTELARLGKDLDFGKHPDRLTTLEKPLFYACKMEIRFMVTLGGLRINNRLQVLDKEQNVIPGLYAAGNVSGSFFGHQYPTTVPGLTHSRAWTFGRLAGRSAAAESW
jgi:fumarate reductase flavoprotein subunit